VTEIDGVRIDYDDKSWILVRQSGTEPKIRIYAQARSPERLKEMISNVRQLVAGISERLGIKIYGVEEHVDLGTSSS
jgi:phosphomannomutase